MSERAVNFFHLWLDSHGILGGHSHDLSVRALSELLFADAQAAGISALELTEDLEGLFELMFEAVDQRYAAT